jgi:hypothetical protein
MLKEEVAKILEPELPSSDLLQKLDAELALKDWLVESDRLFASQEDAEQKSNKQSATRSGVKSAKSG